jgi:hypothetical protein
MYLPVTVWERLGVLLVELPLAGAGDRRLGRRRGG